MVRNKAESSVSYEPRANDGKISAVIGQAVFDAYKAEPKGTRFKQALDVKQTYLARSRREQLKEDGPRWREWWEDVGPLGDAIAGGGSRSNASRIPPGRVINTVPLGASLCNICSADLDSRGTAERPTACRIRRQQHQ